MAGILVPVSLLILNLLSLVTELLSKLSNLKVGSAGFKSVQNLITGIKNEIDKLLVQTSKPFINESLFTKAENSVDKLEDELQRVEITLSRIKFSDLELNPLQKAELKAFEDLINAIKANLKTVKDTAKQDFLGSAMGKVWSEKFDSTAITKSFSEITKSIRAEVTKLQNIVNEAELALNDYLNAMKANDSIELFLKVKNPLEETNLGAEKYALIFLETKNGLRFRAGGSTILEEWLKSQLDLDDATIKGLVEGSALKVKSELEKRLKEIKLANTDVMNKNVSAQTDYTNENARLEQLNHIMELLGFSELSVAVANLALRLQLADTNTAMSDYKDNAVQVVRSNLDVNNTTNAMRTQLDGLRTTLLQTNGEFIRMQRTQLSFNQMKMAVVNFMGFNLVLNLTRNAIRNAINHIRELDTVMNKISIVTDMSTSDLWNLVDAYSKMAQTYGVSIKGAYEVSLIYYQLGLATNDVLILTNETLKLAKISGLDYATTTDYMTTAIRGFKMEMSEASRVVDVYSNLAAHTAVSLEELAVAMSKTASSMEAVGATFEEASAMIGTMVAVTRESATNIGSAMKSIASRYGELTKDPTKLVDEEGEAMAFNKVDAALQSVGISMRTVDGQFREFTDVIVELGEKWDYLDSVLQRYIATLFAGNRQQSRFLALVSNVDLLKSNLDVAMNSEDTGTLQALKALDSIEAKTELVRVAYQLFYTTIGAENAWKGLLDSTKNVINTLNSLPKLFDKLPIGAISVIYDIITLVKGALINGLSSIADLVTSRTRDITGLVEDSSNKMIPAGENFFDKFIAGMTSRYGALKEAAQKGIEEANNAAELKEKEKREAIKLLQMELFYRNEDLIDTNKAEIAKLVSYTSTPVDADTAAWQAENLQRLGLTAEEARNKIKELLLANIELSLANKELEQSVNAETSAENNNSEAKTKNALRTKEGKEAALKYAASHHLLSLSTNAIASGLNMVATMIGTNSRSAQIASGSIMMLSGAMRGFGSILEWVKNLGTASATAFPWMAAIMAAISLINGLATTFETTQEKIERLTQEAEKLNNEAKEAKAEYRTLDNSIKKLNELKEKRYESTEAAEEYLTAVDDLAEKFPAMIAGFDEAGNIILDTTDAERLLAEARNKSKEATYLAALAELEAAKATRDEARNKLTGAINSISSDNYIISRNESIASLISEWLGLTEDEATEISNYTDLEEIFNRLKNYLHIGSGEFINSSNSLSDAKLYLDSLDELSKNLKNFYTLFFGGNEDENSLITKYENTRKELNTLLDKHNESDRPEIEKKFTELKSLYDEAFIKYTNSDQFNFESAASSLEATGELIKSWSSSAGSVQGYLKELISAWQQSSNANIKAWEILSQSGISAAVVTKQIETSLNGQDWNYEQATDALKKEWLGYQETMATFIDSLTTDELSDFERMMNDSANYTTEDFSERFGYKIKNIISFLETWFTDGLTSINERLDEDLLKTSGKTDLGELTGFYDDLDEKRNEVRNNITTTEENYFHLIIALYDALTDLGLASTANKYGTAALGLFDSINSLNGDLEKTIWQLVFDNGLKTIEGINASIEAVNLNDSIDLSSKDSIVTLLETIKNTIIPNINLSIQTATSNLLETWEDTSKELNSAVSNGVNLKEADILINKAKSLGLNFSLLNFLLIGDKLILINLSFDEYYKTLIESTAKTAEDWSTRIEQASALFEQYKNSRSWQYTEEDRAILQSIGFDLTNPEYMKYGELTIDGIKALELAIILSSTNLLNYNLSAEIAAELIAKSWNWSLGNYFNYEIEDESGNKTIIYNSIVHSVEDILTKIAQDISNHFEKNTEERELLDNIYSSYDQLLSDVLSKGINNIHIEDYEGIINDETHRTKLTQALKGNYESFINTYIQYAGKSIDEANDLLLQAIQKDRETKSIDLIKDLQFFNQTQFKTNLSSLNELAKKLDVPLNKILSDAVISYNEALDEYIIDATKIDNLDLSSTEFLNTILNSIEEFFKSLSSYISNALKGSLSSDNARDLLKFAFDLGIGLLLFTRTTDGLKVANNLMRQLVSAARELDSILGEILFNELKDSLIESEDAFKSISSNTEHIYNLRKNITKDIASLVDLTLEQLKLLSSLNGNVDVFNRPVILNADGTISTLKTFTADSRNYESKIPWVMNITPITSDGKELSDTALNEYIDKLFKEAGGDLSKVLALDKADLGLIIELADTAGKDQEKVLLQYDMRAESLHEISALIEEIKASDEFDTTKIDLYKEELRLAEEILAVRSTTEDDTFKFMDLKIPSGQNNPLNYWKNWTEAFEKIQETTKGKNKGTMAYEDFYNIVTEMGNIAKYTEDGINIGGKIVENAELASALIEEAAGALRATSTGDLVVDLGKIGINFAAGVDGMAAGVDKGIDALASEQIKMLDSMIQLLETVVAMEELGKIDVDNDNILDLGEIFEVEYDPNDPERITNILNSYTTDFQTVASAILKSAKDNEDLTKALDLMKITSNGITVTMREMFEDALDGIKDISLDYYAYQNILLSFYAAYLSGDYNLDNLFKSIQSVFANTGFEGEIQLGDQTLIVSHGTTIIKTEDGDYVTSEGTTCDSIEEAVARETVENAGINKDSITYNQEIGIAKGILELSGTNFTITGDTEGNVTYTDALGISGSSLQDYIHNRAEYEVHRGEHATVEEIEAQLAIKYNLTPLDSFTYLSLNAEIKQKLEEALASGKQTEVDAVIKANPVLSSLSGKTGSEIALLLGIKLEDLNLSINVNVADEAALKAITNVQDEIAKIPTSKTTTIYIREQKIGGSKGTIGGGRNNYTSTRNEIKATGNVANAKGTLMGELGPELVVQNGYYFVAGLNGAEFVDLMDDAIVFNHLQTQQLLKNGMSNSRGRALTNERVATAYAQGNVNGGPAMASASAALSALKQLRSMWQSLQKMGSKDLLSAGGGGGGGGGGSKDMGVFLKDLERWYNWLQRIELLEKEINYLELLRAKIESDMIPHGLDYFNSLLVTLGKLEDLVAIRQDLLNSLQEYFNKRRDEANKNSPLSALYTFDETGQLKYREGAFETLSEILSADEYGKPKYTPEEQYKKIIALNPEFANYMKYDSEGKEIAWTDELGQFNPEAYTTALEAFFAKMDADRDEFLSLHDSIEELKVDILENYESMNEILHDIEENLIDVENKVLTAIEDSRQREIDELLDTRDAIEESSNKLIQGLQDLLDNERKMYEAQANSEDLTKLLRQLAILLRSGASSADISNLLTLITDKQYDMYFESLEKQIDAIQLASDALLERLDALIDLMTETLAYEKENGLLWEEVYEHMTNKTPEEIAQFIRDNDSSLWGESPTELMKTDRENLFKLQQWAEFSGKFDGLLTLIDYFTKKEIGTENLDKDAKKEADVINGLATKNASADALAKAAAVLPASTTSTSTAAKSASTATTASTKLTATRYKATYIVYDNTGNKTSSGFGVGSTAAEAKTNATALAKKKVSANGDYDVYTPIQYKYGGMVKEDGEGYLHADEGVLTPEQTSTLRNEILGNKPNSLLSLLMTWRDSVMGLADTSSINNYDSGINIEKAEVIMQVSQIANDYDAQRAGEQALDKIMSIARKTMAQNRIGR